MIVKANDSRILWQGIISLEVTEDFAKPWRIPFEQQELFPPDAILERASALAGVRVSFYSNSNFFWGKLDIVEVRILHFWIFFVMEFYMNL